MEREGAAGSAAPELLGRVGREGGAPCPTVLLPLVVRVRGGWDSGRDWNGEEVEEGKESYTPPLPPAPLDTSRASDRAARRTSVTPLVRWCMWRPGGSTAATGNPEL